VIDHEDIHRACTKISAEFLAAVQGPATQEVATKDNGAAALGQHLRATTNQRGLHGTAAALQVLAETDDSEAQDYARRLVHYVDIHPDIEREIAESDAPPQPVQASDENVIKLSEVLYALAAVPTSLGPREALARRIADQLVNHRNPDGGWPYSMTGQVRSSHILPTAYAVRALASHRYDVAQSVTFLRNYVESTTAGSSDVFIEVLAVYVLCFLPIPFRNDREIRKPFHRLWLQLSPLLTQDLEANIEYVTSKINYVRIPWQLYLLASSSRLSPYRRFTSAKAQRRLKTILDSVNLSGGLLYPHSGRELSSRTNAILFDVLGQIDSELAQKRLPLKPFISLGRARAALASRPFQLAVRVLVVAVIGYVVVRWVTSGQTNLADLAPELLSSVLLILLTGKRED
jgi:hypothetical protein